MISVKFKIWFAQKSEKFRLRRFGTNVPKLRFHHALRAEICSFKFSRYNFQIPGKKSIFKISLLYKLKIEHSYVKAGFIFYCIQHFITVATVHNFYGFFVLVS